jgi:hypothetical protein
MQYKADGVSSRVPARIRRLLDRGFQIPVADPRRRIK